MTSSASRPMPALLDQVARQVAQQHAACCCSGPGSRPKSSITASSSSRASSIVLTIRETDVWWSRLAQRRLQQRRLARADFAGDHDEAGVAFDAVAQVAQRFLVHAARVEVIGIRAQRERPLPQVVKTFIHDGASFRRPRQRRVRTCRAHRRRWPAARRCRRASSLLGNRFRSTGSRGCRWRGAAAPARSRRTRAAATARTSPRPTTLGSSASTSSQRAGRAKARDADVLARRCPRRAASWRLPTRSPRRIADLHLFVAVRRRDRPAAPPAAHRRSARVSRSSSICGWNSTSQFRTTKPSSSRSRASHSE